MFVEASGTFSDGFEPRFHFAFAVVGGHNQPPETPATLVGIPLLRMHVRTAKEAYRIADGEAKLTAADALKIAEAILELESDPACERPSGLPGYEWDVEKARYGYLIKRDGPNVEETRQAALAWKTATIKLTLMKKKSEDAVRAAAKKKAEADAARKVAEGEAELNLGDTRFENADEPVSELVQVQG